MNIIPKSSDFSLAQCSELAGSAAVWVLPWDEAREEEWGSSGPGSGEVGSGP